MERLNQLVSSQEHSREFYTLLVPGFVVQVDDSLVTVLSVHDGSFFGMSKEHGGVMAFSLADIKRVVRFSQESVELYKKLYELC